MDRSADLLAALLGVWKAGAAYLPVDPGYPAERVAFMLADAQVAAVVADAAGAAVLADAQVLGVPVVEAVPVLAGADGAVPAGPVVLAGRVVPAQAAYVMYTSGSTGVPKGVLVPHVAVDRLVRGGGFVVVGAGDVVGQLAPVSFDAATFEIWGALAAGATVAVGPGGGLSAAELGWFLVVAQVRVLWRGGGWWGGGGGAGGGGRGGWGGLLGGGDVLADRACAAVQEELPGV